MNIIVQGGSVLPGTPVNLPGSTLPPDHLWADRSVVLFSDWPELKTVFDAGLLDALPANATDEDKAASPGKWVLNGCGTGLLLPDLGGAFLRPWRPGQSDDADRQAGSRQGDAIRNITGMQMAAGGTHGIFRVGEGASEGALYPDEQIISPNLCESGSRCNSSNYLKFDASRVVPVADENRPLNVALPVAVYMGRHSSELQ